MAIPAEPYWPELACLCTDRISASVTSIPWTAGDRGGFDV